MKATLTIAALILFSLAQAQQPADLSSEYNSAIKLMSEKRYEEAKDVLTKVIETKPDYAESVFARGLCYLMLNQRDNSCLDFGKAKNLNWQPADEYLQKFCGKDAIGRRAQPLELKSE